MGICESVLDTIGNTPLIALSKLSDGQPVRFLGKWEAKNPGGSVKDRVGLAMLRDAEARGLLKPGSTIVEPTSGNTGIALAMAAAALGYRLIITMPETMSQERIALLKMYGAEVVLTPGSLMGEAVAQAKKIQKKTPGAVMLEQFANPANPGAHECGTAREIWRDTEGKFDVFIAGVGTGGTVSGVGRFLKKQRSDIRVVAVEPEIAQVLQGRAAVPHRIQGIGAGFVPENFDRSVVDEIIGVSENQAFALARRLAREEGILAGISAGAAMAAALQLAARAEFSGKTFVVMLPDSGERYLSTQLAITQ